MKWLGLMVFLAGGAMASPEIAMQFKCGEGDQVFTAYDNGGATTTNASIDIFGSKQDSEMRFDGVSPRFNFNSDGNGAWNNSVILLKKKGLNGYFGVLYDFSGIKSGEQIKGKTVLDCVKTIGR